MDRAYSHHRAGCSGVVLRVGNLPADVGFGEVRIVFTKKNTFIIQNITQKHANQNRYK